MVVPMNNLKNKFNLEVLQAVEESKKIGYTPIRFIQMLQQSGNNALEVVPRLVLKESTTGLEKLWEKCRLDLSIEAIIVKSEYRDLFSDEIVNICKKKLQKYGYKF